MLLIDLGLPPVAVGCEHPQAPVLPEVAYAGAQLQPQAEQAEDHFVAPRHLAHDEDDWRREQQVEQVEVHRQQNASARAQEEGHVGHAQEHGRAGAAAEHRVLKHVQAAIARLRPPGSGPRG